MTRTGAPGIGILLGMHFIPGALVFAAYVVAGGHLASLGIPPGLTLNLAFALVGIPVCLALLRNMAHRETGVASITGAVRYRRPVRLLLYFVLVPLFLVFAGLASALMSPVSAWLQDQIAPVAPAWFFEGGTGAATAAVSPWLVFAVRIVVDGMANPIAEELYFRGYLLPRLERLGPWSPAIHGLLFAMAHLWQPHNFPLLAVMVIPLYYTVRYFRSVRLAIAVHCTANLLGALLALP